LKGADCHFKTMLNLEKWYFPYPYKDGD